MTELPTTSKTPIWPLALTGLLAMAALLFRAGPALGGDLIGSDDMMRMQQVRDLIAGQRWYDVDQARLLTPEGGAMHWSRLPDLVLAGIVLLLQPMTGREMAEGIAVTAWPLMQLGWIMAALATCLRRLNVSLAGQLAGLLFFFTSFALVNFTPGRIDHHGLGLALALTAFACLLSPARTPRSAIVAAVCVAAMITVAIENLPAIGLIIIGFSAAWILRGETETNRLRVFGAGLAVSALIAYVFDAPGPGGNRTVCDAFGQPHFIALMVAGGGLFAVATFLPQARDWRTRMSAVALAGAGTVLSFISANPANFSPENPNCLTDPYARLPEEIRTGWLSVVSEARALPAVFAGDPAMAVYYYGFALAGLVTAAIALRQAAPERRFGFAALLTGLAVTFLISAWQLRGISLAHLLAAIAAGWAFGLLFDHWRKARTPRAALYLLAGALAVSPIGWQLPRSLASLDEAETGEAVADCKSREAFQAVASAPRMIAFTPIDLGAPLIYHTRHYATAAPYHRNPSAIEMTLSVFTGPIDTARRKIEMTGADHLLYCPGLSELKTYAKRAPDGLAAALENGEVPDWLTPLAGSEDGSGPILYTIAYDRN
ncbi:hypothetical protein [Henriciella aquimarina]|uniref:hypothetical protein n=1 Tax=Henriciella aquimarina TaxID=545261 RepID=UPI000A052514|nr:hypothetical protein [Henriciella aquimarina]